MTPSELHSGSRAKAPGTPVTARGATGRFAPAEAPDASAAQTEVVTRTSPALRLAGGRVF